MINRDYILRMFERFGHELSIILGLRKRNKHEEALIYIDDLLFQSTGMTTGFINALPAEILLKTLSPLGRLNVEGCLWAAFLLKCEGDIYEDTGKSTESYYRYVKSLLLYLEALLHERIEDEETIQVVQDLIDALDAYELPTNVKERLFAYHEQGGRYDQAENVLFELLEETPKDNDLLERGRAFYTRLLHLGDSALEAGNLPRQEIKEGLAQLRAMK